MELYKLLYNKFPREIGLYINGNNSYLMRRVFVKSDKTFYKLLMKNIYFNATYTTIYGGFKGNKQYQTGIIDKVILDVDNIDDWEKVKKFHNYLLDKNVKHTIIFSGSNGFHIYLFTNKEYDYSYRYYIKHFGKLIREKFGLDIDIKILGDMARLIRIPNSRHQKTNLFAIPLVDKHFELNIEQIKMLARKPNYKWQVWGEKGIRLKKIKSDVEIGDDSSYDIIEIDNIPIPPFIQKILDMKKEGWRKETGHYERMAIILYLFEVGGWSVEKVKEFMRQYLTEEEYSHMLKEKQVEHLYKRFFITKDYNFPSLNVLKMWVDVELTNKDVEILNEYIYDLRRELLNSI